MKQILPSCSASISELKKNPTTLLNEADSAPIAIFNHTIIIFQPLILSLLKPMNG
uniref:Antitoxin n=1 Tax=Chlorobium chlorochromatii (strain CaD3) TaxID=340177 RepID=Q3AUB2_CHLCH